MSDRCLEILGNRLVELAEALDKGLDVLLGEQALGVLGFPLKGLLGEQQSIEELLEALSIPGRVCCAWDKVGICIRSVGTGQTVQDTWGHLAIVQFDDL